MNRNVVSTLVSRGDVIAIPVSETEFGIGQVVEFWGDTMFYLAIFEKMASGALSTTEIDHSLASRILVIALTTDGRLYNDLWFNIANRPVIADVPLPAAKFGDGEASMVMVESANSQLRRPATPAAAAFLPLRTSVSPMRAEKAFMAMIGRAEWKDYYGRLAPSPGTADVHFFPELTQANISVAKRRSIFRSK